MNFIPKKGKRRISILRTAYLPLFDITQPPKKLENNQGIGRVNSIFDTIKMEFSAGIMAFLRGKTRKAPKFWAALFSKNAVYVSKSAHKVVKTRSELTETNRSPTVRNGEFRRKLAPETSRRAQRRILRGEFSGVLFFAQPSNWGGISEKKKSAINRSHGAGLRKNGGLLESWTLAP